MVLPALAIGAAGVMAAKGLYDIYSQNKADARAERAMKEQLARMQHAATVYEGYRPQMAGARRAAYESSVQPYQGAQNALTTLYGQSTPEQRAYETGQGLANMNAAAAGSDAGNAYAQAHFERQKQEAAARMAEQKANRANATSAQTNMMAMRPRRM